ncbi:MAG: HAMP domain-containing histidine kinase [Gemmatimonadaceae bacterium]|nr:HAMP domain-containing histidine kinase [Gemmatimonadaceae bacterium]
MTAANTPAPPTHPSLGGGHDHPLSATALYAQRMAHDLNNFATVIRSYGELLLNDLPEGDTRNDVAEIHRATEALVSYVHRVTHFARTAGMRPSATPVDVAVRAVADEFAEARERAAVVVGALSTRSVVVDASWFHESLQAIILNAREAAPPASTVTVSSTDELDTGGRSWVRITVTDHGPGFAPSVAAVAEDPYVTTKQGVRGAGFGLTIAATCAAMSGGRLERAREGNTTCVALVLRAHG